MKTNLTIIHLENCIDELKECRQFPSVKNRIKDYQTAIDTLRQAKEATAILPRVMPRFSDKKPPVDEVVVFVWWHRNGFEASQKTLGFIDAANVLHLDFTPAGGKEPTFWCFLNGSTEPFSFLF